MLKLGDKSYPLCLLDTCAVSEMIKQPDKYLVNFLGWSQQTEPSYIAAFSVFTLMELRRKPELFAQFVETFKDVPAVILRGMDELLDDEISHYPDPSSIPPVGLALTPFGGEGNKIENLPGILNGHSKLVAGWEAGIDSALEGMTSLIDNYLPDGDAYSKADRDRFLLIVVTQHLGFHNMDFARGVLEGGEAIDLDAFPSVKTLAYTVWHKFYVNRDRKAQRSDVFDVLISTALPYVEAVVTEAHLAEALHQVQNQDGFLGDLKILTLRDLRTKSS